MVKGLDKAAVLRYRRGIELALELMKSSNIFHNAQYIRGRWHTFFGFASSSAG